MEVIDSIKDPRISAARALGTRPGRLAAGRCLVEGIGLIRQALAAGAEVDYVLRSATAAEAALPGVTVHVVRDGLLRKVTGSAKPVDWLAVAVLPAETGPAEPYGDFAVVCEQVADPGNLGTIVRTARALGVRDVVVTDPATDLSSRRVLDAARGAVLGCRVRRFDTTEDALKALRDNGFQIVVTSPRGSHVQSMAPLRGRKVALVVGNETEGVTPETLAGADLAVRIPMAGAVESLNVGVATGISIYELRMRMILTMLTDRIRDSLGRNLGVTAQLVRAAFDAQPGEFGELDSAQVVLLMVVVCERSTPVDQLRRDLGATEDELAELVRPLRERGYLTGDGDAVTITRDGEQAVAALWTVQERVEEDLYAGFTPAERDQLHELLGRVRQNAIRLRAATAAGGPELG
ncbi:hypothetical protein OG943_26055 [Amycolatopsis sp. NBC_00345]|uniref:TrmH family RNA methyltransferase n=1 Tax=Amycolatopsis sp. NBC_00345 TaxID=2975955 RepID=UPI002E269297